ncbi:MAG: hypothetical protein JWL86_1917 [Rhizobium sp.]|nr:hypothetical protein [Rhizobium sp.]
MGNRRGTYQGIGKPWREAFPDCRILQLTSSLGGDLIDVDDPLRILVKQCIYPVGDCPGLC